MELNACTMKIGAYWSPLKPMVLNRLHSPPKENKHLRGDGLKGLLPYIRAGAVDTAANDGYSRLGFLSPGCTRGTGDSSEFPNPV